MTGEENRVAARNVSGKRVSLHDGERDRRSPKEPPAYRSGGGSSRLVVAVGYDTTRLLFADSWGPTYCESNARGTDVCRAGYSLVDKWLVCVARE